MGFERFFLGGFQKLTLDPGLREMQFFGHGDEVFQMTDFDGSNSSPLLSRRFIILDTPPSVEDIFSPPDVL